jgi:hypothetical protein
MREKTKVLVWRLFVAVLCVQHGIKVEHSLSWEADGRSVGREIPRLLWNEMVQYRFQLEHVLRLSFHLRSLSFAGKNRPICGQHDQVGKKKILRKSFICGWFPSYCLQG